MEDTLHSTVELDPITVAVARRFDYTFDGNSSFTPPQMPPVELGFGIGLIVGPSGTGKSTLLHQRFGVEEKVAWHTNRSVCAHFDSEDDAIDRLSAVGFNSLPAWARPYGVLSTGEKFRADLARRLRDGAVIDEFTSVVDRNVAKACSVALRRYVDREGVRGIVLATCHYDILEWLQPDWWFDTATGRLESGCRSRPKIELEILPCTAVAWSTFEPHHYLDSKLNKSARCWMAVWNGALVGFASALAFPNGNFKKGWREHRTVVLPDYQGLGLGVRISDAVADLFVREGGRYFSKTSHPRMGAYRDMSPLWKATTKNNRARADYGYAGKVKEEGFIDSKGAFLSRTEAWKRANSLNQIKRRVGGDGANGGTLYSESLY